MLDLMAFVRRRRGGITVTVALLLVVLGVSALRHLVEEIDLHNLRLAFGRLSTGRILIALACTVVSYLLLTLYDVLALRIIGRALPWRVAALASFTSYALSHNLGLSPVTGGSARYRIYSGAGLAGPDIARIVAIAGATFWMGVIALSAAALLFHPGALAIGGLTVSPGAVHAAGGVAAAIAAGAVLLCGSGLRAISLFGWRLPLPTVGQALAQFAVAGLDIMAAGTALFVLVPGVGPALLPTFMLAYALGIVGALLTHVPGGVGVFEAVVIAVVPGDKATLLAALLVYRVVYYLLPLALAVMLLAWRERGRQRGRVAGLLAGTRAVATGIAPTALSAACFVGGAVLLVSGSLPAVPSRLRFLADVLPLPFIEASHIASSLAGTGLLLLAPGLYRRLDGAFVATRALLLAAAVFSLAKGLDYEEAAVCMMLAALLQWTRPAFYRRTALTQQPFSPGWLVPIASVVILSVWIGFISYDHVEYTSDLWWRFALRVDASRFLRGSLSAGVLLGGVALWRLLAPAPARPAPPTADDVSDVERILQGAQRTEAMLAWTGDKRFLLSPARDTFLMYQVQGSSWIVMGDPVGPVAAWTELLWTVRSMADAAQGRLLLYQVGACVLDLAIGMGLAIIKYGEEAVIDLRRFDLADPRLRQLRKAERRAAREGATFEIAAAARVPALLPELAAISDRWIKAKNHREKGFSLGRFDPDYLARFDCALVRQGDRIVAFANIWSTANKRELSVDLMRHGDPMPHGAMDFLFVHLIAWGRANGYDRFNLGLAPLSGIEGRRLAPAWARAAQFVFRNGERLYGFRGLRAYKEKFAPEWEPRYIAGPRGIAMLRAWQDLSALITNPGRPAGAERRAIRDRVAASPVPAPVPATLSYAG